LFGTACYFSHTALRLLVCFCVIAVSIEGDIVPKEGDEVTYKQCLMPPKNEKYAAVHVHIAHQAPVAHEKWDKDAIERPICSANE